MTVINTCIYTKYSVCTYVTNSIIYLSLEGVGCLTSHTLISYDVEVSILHVSTLASIVTI